MNSDAVLSNTVQENQGYVWRFINSRGEIAKRVPFCLYCADHKYDEKIYSKLWPLEVGKSITILRESLVTERAWENTISVESIDTISTSFGTYEVFVVEGTSKQIRGGKWSGKGTWYYSPELRWYVKFNEIDSQGTQYEYELIKYDVK